MVFAFATASAGVRNVSAESTGPKISSRAIRCAEDTSVNTVGANQYPVSGSGQSLVHRVAPSSSPAWVSATIRSSWAAERSEERRVGKEWRWRRREVRENKREDKR